MAKKATFQLPMEIDIVNPIANLDARYGPYASIADALAGVPISLRKQGRTVGIVENGKVVEYCWSEGTADNQLVPKTADLTAVYEALSNKADKDVTYTKSEVDSMLTAVYTAKGACSNADIPTKAAIAQIGYVYNLTDNGAYGSAGDNLVYIGPVGSTAESAWSNLGKAEHQTRTFTVRTGTAGQLQPLFELGSGNSQSVLMQYEVSSNGNCWSDELHYSKSAEASDDSFYTCTHVSFVEHRTAASIAGIVCMPVDESTNQQSSTTITLTVVIAGCSVNWFSQDAPLVNQGDYDRQNTCIVAPVDLTGAIDLHTNANGDILDSNDEPVTELADDTLYTIDAAASYGQFSLPVRNYVDTRIFCYGSGTAEYNGQYYDYENAAMLWLYPDDIYVEQDSHDYYTKGEIDRKLNNYLPKSMISQVSNAALQSFGKSDNALSTVVSTKPAIEEALNAMQMGIPDAVVTHEHINHSKAYVLLGYPDFSNDDIPYELHMIQITFSDKFAVLQYRQMNGQTELKYVYGTMPLCIVQTETELGNVLTSLAMQHTELKEYLNANISYRLLQHMPRQTAPAGYSYPLSWKIPRSLDYSANQQIPLSRTNYGASRSTYLRNAYEGISLSSVDSAEDLPPLFAQNATVLDAPKDLCITAGDTGATMYMQGLVDGMYRVNDGNWQAISALPIDPDDNQYRYVALSANDRMYLKATDVQNSTGAMTAPRIWSDEAFDASGDIMSLLNYDAGMIASTASDEDSGKFSHLFAESSIRTADRLIMPATQIGAFQCAAMFRSCESLQTAPALPALHIRHGCYQDMFYGCTSLQVAPALPSMYAPGSGYKNMFTDCTSLRVAPALPATHLVNECYAYMFAGCTSLNAAPALPAMNLAPGCYAHMFAGCTNLLEAPELPAMYAASNCYEEMFAGCSALQSASIGLRLIYEVASIRCMSKMFYQCTQLYLVSINAIDWTTASDTVDDWMHGVAEHGKFIINNNILSVGNQNGEIPANNDSGIPAGWTVYGGASQNPGGNPQWINF